MQYQRSWPGLCQPRWNLKSLFSEAEGTPPLAPGCCRPGQGTPPSKRQCPSLAGVSGPDGGRLPLREDSPGRTPPATHTLQVQMFPRPRLPVCSHPPPVMSGSEVTKLQILSAFPFINVTFKAPLAQVNHNYISKGLWYHSKSSDSQSCQWKASRSVSLSLSLSLSLSHTHTHTHTHRVHAFPTFILFFCLVPQ